MSINSVQRVIVVASLAGLSALGVVWFVGDTKGTDFGQIWFASRALFAGQNPYDLIGPDRAFVWPRPLYYPVPALVIAAPFALLPLRIAEAAFLGVGAGALAWVCSARLTPLVWTFPSAAFMLAVMTAQWSPLLTAAALSGAWGILLVAKPSIGAALFIAYPSLEVAIGIVWILVVTIGIWPWWPVAWLMAVWSGEHMTPPAFRWGGPLLLLAVLRWRDPRARLLLGLSLVPQNPQLYEALPLFLIPRTHQQGAILAALTMACGALWAMRGPYATYDASMNASGQWMVWLVYLPALALVLWRHRSVGST